MCFLFMLVTCACFAHLNYVLVSRATFHRLGHIGHNTFGSNGDHLHRHGNSFPSEHCGVKDLCLLHTEDRSIRLR